MRTVRSMTSERTAGHIREQGNTDLLKAPGVNAKVSEAQHGLTWHKAWKASVAIDGAHHARRSGYSETGVWLFAPRAGTLGPQEAR